MHPLLYYTQYGFIRNGLIRNTTEIFRIFKERLLKFFGIRNKFSYLRNKLLKTTNFSWKIQIFSEIFGNFLIFSEIFWFFQNFSDFFWNFLIFSKIFWFFQNFSDFFWNFPIFSEFFLHYFLFNTILVKNKEREG